MLYDYVRVSSWPRQTSSHIPRYAMLYSAYVHVCTGMYVCMYVWWAPQAFSFTDDNNARHFLEKEEEEEKKRPQ